MKSEERILERIKAFEIARETQKNFGRQEFVRDLETMLILLRWVLEDDQDDFLYELYDGE